MYCRVHLVQSWVAACAKYGGIFVIKKLEILPETVHVLVLQICDGGPSHFGAETGKNIKRQLFAARHTG